MIEKRENTLHDYNQLFAISVQCILAEMILSDMRLGVLVEKIERQIEETSGEYVTVFLEPLADDRAMVVFENWLPRNRTI